MQDRNAEVLRHLATNLRRLRQGLGLSQIALAEASGLSRRLIVDIEAGQANVSLGNLDRLARSLGVGFTDLVAAPDTPLTAIAETAWQGADGSRAALLGQSPAREAVELWHWRLAAGDSYQAEPDPSGWQEMIFVTKGHLRLQTEGEMRQLAAGEFAIFPSDQRYGYHNDSAEQVEFLRNVVR